MSQVTDPVLLDSTGQNIATGISAIVSAIQNRGMPSPSASNPQMDGTVSPGTSNDYARGDHVHPENPANAKTAQLAYVETGTTASRNYSAGEYICWNGLTYTADTNIALGATLSASGGNKNLTECVGGGFNDVTTFTVTPSSGVTISGQSNYKIGNLVFLYLEFTISSNMAGWTPVFTLPFPAFFGAFYLAASGAMPVSQVLYSSDNYTVSKGRNALPAGVYLVSVMGHIPR